MLVLKGGVVHCTCPRKEMAVPSWPNFFMFFQKQYRLNMWMNSSLVAHYGSWYLYIIWSLTPLYTMIYLDVFFSKGHVFLFCLGKADLVSSFNCWVRGWLFMLYTVRVFSYITSLPLSLFTCLCNKWISKCQNVCSMQIFAGDTKGMILFLEFIHVCRLEAMQYRNYFFELS